MSKTKHDLIAAREKIAAEAATRLQSEMAKPTKDVFFGLLLNNRALLSRIREHAIMALRDIDANDPVLQAYRRNIETIRKTAYDARDRLTSVTTRDALIADLAVVDEAIVRIQKLAAAAIKEPKIVEKPMSWNEAIQLMQAPKRHEEETTVKLTSSAPSASHRNATDFPVPAYSVDSEGMLSLACRTLGKWGMRLDLDQSDDEAFDDLVDPATRKLRPAPYLDASTLRGSGCREQFLFFDTEEELEKCFRATVGPDGATETNPHSGPARVRAVTCTPQGEKLDEKA